MPSPDRDEDHWIAAVARRFPRDPRVLVGIGHDAALLRLEGPEVVLKTDTVIDGVDFRLEECGPVLAGRKALLVTLSDLAACAALPRACVVSAVLPAGVAFETFDGLAQGIAEVAAETHCAVVGGDTSVARGPLTITVAVVGEPGPHGFLTRSGARPGDALSVTGPLGGSAGGRHLRVRPRLAEAQTLARLGVPHAMMDLSDGLSIDLPRLCAASGVGADLEAEAIPVHPDARGPGAPRSPLEHALHDGEDFELLLAHAPLTEDLAGRLEREGVGLHRIGTVTGEPGRLRLLVGGRAEPLPRSGYDHLAREGSA